MNLTEEELQASYEDCHALVRHAKDVGVWVFGGAIDDSASPVRVEGDGSVTDGTHEETRRLDGGFTILEVPSREAALDWAARFAEPVDARKRCARSSTTPPADGAGILGTRVSSVQRGRSRELFKPPKGLVQT